MRRLLTAVALVAATTGCSNGPSGEELRSWATSVQARAARTTAEQRIRQQIAGVEAIDGLEAIGTRLVDSCDRRPPRSVFDADRPTYELRCTMRAVATFRVAGRVQHVLAAIRTARIAEWGAGDDVPTTAGTVAYALTYLRRQGRYPDGRLMPTPELRTAVTESPSMVIDWDRSNLERPEPISEMPSCPPRDVYLRCDSVPDPLPSLATVRARHGTILQIDLGSPSRLVYFEVPRT